MDFLWSNTGAIREQRATNKHVRSALPSGAHLGFFGARTFLSASGLTELISPISPITLITPIPGVVVLGKSKMRISQRLKSIGHCNRPNS